MIVGGQVFPGSRGQKTRSGKTTGRPVVGRRMPLRDTWESTRLAMLKTIQFNDNNQRIRHCVAEKATTETRRKMMSDKKARKRVTFIIS